MNPMQRKLLCLFTSAAILVFLLHAMVALCNVVIASTLKWRWWYWWWWWELLGSLDAKVLMGILYKIIIGKLTSPSSAANWEKCEYWAEIPNFKTETIFSRSSITHCLASMQSLGRLMSTSVRCITASKRTISETCSNKMSDKFKQFSHSGGGTAVDANRERGRVTTAPSVYHCIWIVYCISSHCVTPAPAVIPYIAYLRIAPTVRPGFKYHL